MKKFTRLLLCAMVVSNLISHTPATTAAPLDQTTLTVCTSLKTGNKLISKTGKCNERIYEARTWFQKGFAPSGTPESKPIDLVTCTSKTSTLQIIRTRAACNSKTQTTSLWQRPLGSSVAPLITSVAMGLLGTATLNIAPPAEDGGARITSYLVTSSPAAVAATYTPAQIKAAKITGLTPGSTYSFSVVAINSKGSSPSSIASTPALAPTIPSAPGITKVVATGTNSALLTFTAPLGNGGSSVASYVATSLPGGLQTTVYQSAGGTINITNLSHSTTYTFTLTAISAAGSSLASAISTSITTATPPPPPEPVVAAPSAPIDTVISVAAIAGVTAPVTGATPVTTTTAGTGYTGTVSWSGAPTTFAGVTTYTATITLTPASGYTLIGVTANFFTVAGATTDTNPANSGVITAVFPATEVGAATKVAITRASVGTQRRTAFTTQPQITVQDASGNTVTSSSAVVSATVSAGGTLIGTTSAMASSGVATFSGLGVDGTIGATYTITYTVSGLTVATATVTLTGATCDGSFTCQIGDTGPGGGIIFYVAPAFFTQVGATGSMCTTNCKYLEAAPNTWSGGSLDPTRSWATDVTNNRLTTVPAPGAIRTAIGTGYQNSDAIVAQSGNVAATSAAVAARGYTGGSKNDWYLPSKDELNQFYLQRTAVGGFVTGFYWSSSESAVNTAWFRLFTHENFESAAGGKDNSYYVRPVRAFGPAPIVISVAAIAGVTAPVTGATPATTTTAGTGYTGTVTWASSGGALVGNFAAATTYTATITLTAAAGYTLTGVSENFFTVAGATTDTNSADSGVITAVFPKTIRYCDGSTFTCQVGDTGPGGGIIFYVAPAFFTQVGATGSMCTTNCKYLEAAPNTWSGGSSDPTIFWSTGSNQSAGVTGADGTAIGDGYKNSLDVVGQAGNVAASSAAVAARGYSGGSMNDWFLPSKDELNQFYLQRTAVGGFGRAEYWSSSEFSAGNALYHLFFESGVQGNFGKNFTFFVRPVRAFGPAPIVISVAAIAGVTAPVTGATPATTTTAGTGYTGTVTWASSGGALVGNFAAATTYTATITLTAAAGYTLTGVSENFFTVAGATTDTNSADSGVITAVFPKTIRYCDGSTFTCQVGDTGPGGGIVFYVSAEYFTSTGSTCNATCKYLEAAPNTWSGGSLDPTRSWATDVTNNRTTTVPAPGAIRTAIGTGYQNSDAIVAQSGNVAATSAAVAARGYTGGSKNDWYLPSKDELNQFYLQRTAVGGFVTGFYWSSSESAVNTAWFRLFTHENFESAAGGKDNSYYVRPVRAF